MNRTIAPPFSQAKDLQLIFPEKIELNNGSVLYWLKDVKDDSVKLDIQWDAGTKHQEQHLVAGFTNKMLLSGSSDYTAKEIAHDIDFHGGYAQYDIDKDHAGVVLYGLNDNIKAIFNVFSRAFEVLEYPEKEFEKELSIAQDKFKVESQKVKVLARREFNRSLFGAESGYGQVAQADDFNILKRSDLQNYFEKKYKKTPVIFLTGNVSQEFIDEIKSWMASFNTSGKEEYEQEFNQQKGRIEVEKKDAVQSAIRIGRLMFDKNHPDYFNFQLLNTILGGYFGSRLMANIREDKGYTYGIGSGLAVMQDAGYFYITTEVGADVKEDAIKEVYNEFDRLKENLISADELTKVKNYMLGEFLRHADGPIAMMEVFKNIYFNHLPKTYYSDFIAAIHKATADDLKELANKYLVKGEMLEVVAG